MSEPQGRGAAWTEERSDERRRHLEAPRRRAGNSVNKRWWRMTALIAEREVRQRGRSRAFAVSTIVLLLVVAAAVAIPAIVAHHSKPQRVGIVGAPVAAMTEIVREAGHLTGTSVTVVPEPSLASADRLTGLFTVVLVWVLISAYGGQIAMGVGEEKSNRIVEVILAAVRPLQLLVGKVGGIGLLALAQAGLMVAVFLGLGTAVGSSLVHGAAPGIVIAGAVFLVLGYAFYCTASPPPGRWSAGSPTSAR